MNSDLSSIPTVNEELTQREKEWEEVENLIATFQIQFQEDCTDDQLLSSKEAASELLQRFSPLFKKYVSLLKYGQIDFNDVETKLFVCSFINDASLQRALRRTKQKADYRNDIYKKFNFIKETYGQVPDEEMMMDLQTIFLVLAKRYKVMGKSFCGYLYNSYRHEMSRHIKKFIKNPLNISYKNVEYEDYMNGKEDVEISTSYEDNYYEDATGLPDLEWIVGRNCSEAFVELTPLHRKILIKYYLEEWNDRQISEQFGIHINTVNQKRRQAVTVIAEHMNIDIEDIKRNRRSGKQVVMPI
jgi:DNA-directed RNA polymerase specialized sigma24 family protein